MIHIPEFFIFHAVFNSETHHFNALNTWFGAFSFFLEVDNILTDQQYMRRALELAARGMGRTAPNPMVGAVIVKDEEIIAEGWHHQCGGLHAERDALSRCTADPAGATMYVTLEPCCHTGRQPPCVEAILDAGISRVVIGSPDPNPLVAGKGVSILQENGVAVRIGVLREECDRLNQVFLHYITRKQPYVVMKYAMTMDGKIAAYTGLSQWITGEEARAHVQTQRHRCTGIMVGVGTVLADDPMLTCRMEGGKNPVRIICDSGLRTPLDSKLVSTAREVPTILATCSADEEKIRAYEGAGCTVIRTPAQAGRVDLPFLMKELGRREIDSILLEGGGTLNWSMLSAGLVCKVQAYIAPKLFGGYSAKTPVEGQGFPSPAEAVLLEHPVVTQLGPDILIESEVIDHVYRHR